MPDQGLATPKSQTFLERLPDFVELTRLNRPAGIFLGLWPALWALWLAAEGNPKVHLVLFTLALIPMARSAGCVLNDYADRTVDVRVSRTRRRPLVTGRVLPNEALALFAVLLVMGLSFLLFTNWLTRELSAVAICLGILYPLAKRYTNWPQIVIGMMNAAPAVLLFAAQTDSVPPRAWLAFLAIASWTIAYDSIYAMTDRLDDVGAGVKSLAVRFAERTPIVVALFQGAALILLIVLGVHTGLGRWYYLSLVGILGLFVYQQHLILSTRGRSYLTAFENNQWVGFLLFAGTILTYA